MNFFRNVRDQRIHNHAHQVNYTAGFVCVMECCAERQCECGSLPAESIDREAALAVGFRDFDLSDGMTDQYFQEAAAYLFGTALGRYFKESMAQKRNSDGSAKYKVDRAPLSEIKARQRRSQIYCMRTFGEDEASIAGTISILKMISEELGLAVGDDGVDLRDKVVMYHGDYLTVRNLRTALHRRRVEVEPAMRFGWVEPVAGLFHLQMNVLKMLMHAFEGEPAGESFRVTRFTRMLRRQGISKDIKDFHACDEFFRNLGDGYIIAFYMHCAGIPAGSFDKLQDHLAVADWPKTIRKAVEKSDLGLFQVDMLRGKATDAVLVEVKERMAVLRKEREQLLEERRKEKAATGQKQERLPGPRWANVQKKLELELSGPARDVVRENALLLLISVLVYQDFHDACRGGYSGRVEKCVQIFAVMFQGTRFGNYASECVHLVASLNHIWKPEFKRAWLDYCLINPDGRTFCAVDRHGETIIRENKDKVRPSANAKDDSFLRDTIARNVPTLRACRQVLYECTGSTNYGTRHSLMNTFHDVALIANTLAQNRVYTFTGGRGKEVKEMPNLIQLGTEALASGRVIKKYKDNVRAKSLAMWAEGYGKSASEGAGSERPNPGDEPEAEDSDEDQFEGLGCDIDALQVEGDTMPGVNDEDDDMPM